MKKFLLLGVVFLFSCAGFSQPQSQVQEVDNCDSTTLKILSCNIYMLPNPANPKIKLTRAHIIGEYLKDCPYDIIVLQEAFDFRARNIIAEHLENSYPFRIGPGN